MKLEDLKVGDRVRIRSWEEMEKEFEVSDDGDKIYCELSFVKGMKHLYGRTAIVKSIDEGYVELTDWSNKDGDMIWVFSADMLELAEAKENTSFTKKDLKFGMIVELRKGVKCLIHPERNYSYVFEESIKDYLIDHLPEGILFHNLLNGVLEIHLGCLTNDLRENSGISSYDIIRVYKDYTLKEVLWERKEVPQLSDEAISLLKLLPKEYKWIAKDKSNSVWVYEEKPNLVSGDWNLTSCRYKSFNLFRHLFEDLDLTQCYLIEDLINGWKNEKNAWSF